MTTNSEETNDHVEQNQPTFAGQPVPQDSGTVVNEQEADIRPTHTPSPQAAARTSMHLGVWSTVFSSIALFSVNSAMTYISLIGIVLGVIGLVKVKQAAGGGLDPIAGRALSTIGVSLGAFIFILTLRFALDGYLNYI